MPSPDEIEKMRALRSQFDQINAKRHEPGPLCEGELNKLESQSQDDRSRLMEEEKKRYMETKRKLSWSD
jgi:hypothetical protein